VREPRERERYRQRGGKGTRGEKKGKNGGIERGRESFQRMGGKKKEEESGAIEWKRQSEPGKES
jgi:hypothetical protein